MLTTQEATQLKADIGALIDQLTEVEEESSASSASSVSSVSSASSVSSTSSVSSASSSASSCSSGSSHSSSSSQSSAGNTLGPGLVEFEEIHVHVGETITILPGTELVRIDVPPANPSHGDGGIVVHGTLIAVRTPQQAPIVIRSANPTGHRGHLMCHGDMVLDGVEIRDFGRTKIAKLNTSPGGASDNFIARYACHFHEAGNRPNSRVENCLIHDTVVPSIYRHGIVLHGTNQVTIRGNTIQEKGGTGIFTEDGTETDNIIEDNVIEDIRSSYGTATTTTTPQRPVDRPTYWNDFGFEGAAIWLRGPLNIVRNNTIRRCGIGVELFFDEATTQYEPINILEDITIENCSDGFQPWYVGANEVHNHVDPPLCPVRQYIDRFTISGCKRGIFAYYQGRVTWRDFVVDNCDPTGVTFGDYRQWECEAVRMTVTGSSNTGVFSPVYVNNGFLFDDCSFSGNLKDFVFSTPSHNGDGRFLPQCAVTIRNSLLQSTTKISMQATVGGMPNYILMNTLNVEDFQKQAGDDFQVYYDAQAASAILPQTANSGKIVGSPEANKTNQYNWDTYGIARAGAIMPADATTRTGIAGGKVK